MDALIKRVKTRFLDDEEVPSDDVIGEIIETISDRLKIRIDVDELPERAGSIIVDASMKSLRLRGYEGSTSESASGGGSLSNSFVTAILDEYEDDIQSLRKSCHKAGVKFL